MLINDEKLVKMDPESYKRYHEARMANHTGSSVFEIETVLTSVSLGVFLRLWMKFCTCHLYNNYLVFLVDFLSIVLPITMEVTIASSISYMIPLNMVVILATMFSKCSSFSNIREILSKKISNSNSYITNYRASTNLVSVLCILAVDFSIFPRRYAKTESFGFGLMDLGVGYFICSNGIVTKKALSGVEFMKIVKSSGFLILLGLIRLLSVKSTGYHEHASEYGVHWNFFLTLGFCRIASFFVMKLVPVKNPFWLAFMTGLLHEIMLYFGLQEWVIAESPRDNLLSANREGIVSLLGYVSLYFASTAVGQLIKENESEMTYKKLFFYLSWLSIISWSCTGICYSTIGISRRLANPGYNFWIISSTLTVLLEFVVIDIFISSIDKSFRKNVEDLSQSPVLMKAINLNGLFFFLLSNLLTGAINMTFQTFLLDSVTSFALIALYMIILCGVCFVFHTKNFVLKFW